MYIDPTKPLTVEALARAIDPACWQAFDERGPQTGYVSVYRGPPWFEAACEESIANARRMLDGYVASLGTTGAQEPLCEDEGCPHSHIPHVCVTPAPQGETPAS